MVESEGSPPAEGAIALSEELRQQLGLDAHEELSVLEISEAAVLLRRCRSGEPLMERGLPALRADVATLPLGDVLGAIHATGKSGLLEFRHRAHLKTVYLQRGEVVFATSNQRVDRLGECLLRAGVITLEQLREAERCFEPPDRFGKVLVERGFLTPRELWNGVKYQVEEVVRSLFSCPAGTICFWEGDAQPDNVVRLALETRRLVAEGIQRRDELRKFLAVLEDPRVRLAVADGFGGQLAGNERAMVDAIGAERSFLQLCDALGFDRESAARSIQLLRLVGAVKLVRSEPDEEYLGESDLDRPDEESIRERISCLTKLISELSEIVCQVEDSDQVQQRLERVLDEATGRFPALLTGVSLGAGAALDADLLADRVVKLPGDREAQIAGALGELVSYLEFEIKNHPQIPDPDARLESVGELRAAVAGS
jgi:hypothetical protein